MNNTTISQYVMEQWIILGSVAGKFSAQQNAGAITPPVGFSSYLGMTALSAYAVAAGDYFLLQQPLDGYSIADLGFGTANAKSVTFSFWAYADAAGTYGGSLRNYATTRSYPFTYTVNTPNTWEYKTITIPGDTAGTWVGASGEGSLYVAFGLGCGSTFSGVAGAWTSANYISATGARSIVETNGAKLYITSVQLEPGSTATLFDTTRTYAQELMLCQRYFEQSTNQIFWSGYGTAGTNNHYAQGTYKVTKRAPPTVTVNVGYGTNWCAIAFNSTGVDSCSFYGNPTTNGANYYSLSFTANCRL
ncbi:MAG: hypothetical protein MO853_14185 [Candidatus Protistobacter heckmanni]|nr:hypothetical protein [Candidatus Protistobacter heckmanni]MCS6764867.1 hypothetical protein [Candidatus Protistobacter heckmanni]